MNTIEQIVLDMEVWFEAQEPMPDHMTAAKEFARRIRENTEQAMAAKLQAESTSLKQIAELNAQIAIDLKAERDQLQAESAGLRSECADLNQRWAEWKDSLDSVMKQRNALQSQLGDAIQSSAHWQHQCTELQAENERLKEEAKQWQSLSELSLGMAEAHSKERNALQAKLDAVGKGEPVAWIKYLIGAEAKPNGQCYDIVFVACDGYEPLYAAPKALAPLKDEPWMVKAIDEAYGIHAKGGQQ